MSDASEERNEGYAPWINRGILALAVAYLGAVLVATLLVLRYGDRWWPATVLIYAPRWPLLVPGVVLVPVVLAMRKWLSAALFAGGALVVAWLTMGFNVPSGGQEASGAALKVVTFNEGSAGLTSALSAFVDREKPDVVVVEECGLPSVPKGSFIPGYDERRTHSICILSRLTFKAFEVRDPKDLWDRGGAGEIGLATLDGPSGTFNLLALHLETVREGLEELIKWRSPRGLINVTELRRDESRLALAFGERAKYPLIVAGDLNMPIESGIYADYWASFRNAFSDCGWGYGHTKATRWFGIRIDHVLTDDNWTCQSAEVGEELGSDHRPLIVQLSRL